MARRPFLRAVVRAVVGAAGAAAGVARFGFCFGDVAVLSGGMGASTRGFVSASNRSAFRDRDRDGAGVVAVEGSEGGRTWRGVGSWRRAIGWG